MRRKELSRKPTSRFVKPSHSFGKNRKRILIVTEGEKSETSYFARLVSELELTTVKIAHSKGTSPKNVVETAINKARRLKNFNRVYCVFDRDANDSSYVEAFENLNRATAVVENCQFVAIPSIPCFEFWYLLHIRYSDRSYGGTDSSCKQLISDLRKHKLFRDYDKSSCSGFYEDLVSRRGQAIVNARRLLAAATQIDAKPYFEDPSTRVHLIVESLIQIAKHSLSD